ncbi:MAG: hypothetical protein VXV97_17325, partial [Pseudomonadota bacterium]|nr:hypothetical protein [Pseudomonadota bacterium]
MDESDAATRGSATGGEDGGQGGGEGGGGEGGGQGGGDNGGGDGGGDGGGGDAGGGDGGGEGGGEGGGGGGAAGVTATQVGGNTPITKDQLQRDPCAWLDTYIGLGMPVDWYEVVFKEGRQVGHRHPLLGEVIRSAPHPR